jgi:pimeloyl-ACP methyl ester carboxylesterase
MNIEINKIHINYTFFNNELFNIEKPLLVFLHEGLGCIEMWGKFPKLLSDTLNLPALLYDRYGYGKSSKLKEKREIFYLHDEADFLKNLLKKLSIKNKIIIFGHSDGGTIALLYASKYPKNILAVITEAHHIIIEKESQAGIKIAVDAYENNNLRELLKRYHGDNVDTMFYGWANPWLTQEAEKYTLIDELTKIKAPVLSFQGEKDQYGTFTQLKVITDYCPNKQSEIHWLKNCGHNPHKEKTEFIIDKTTQFLKEIV